VTRQYLAYVDQIRKRNLELASRIPADGGHADRDQVAHAAAAQEDGDGSEEAEDPRAELVRRLLEYEQMKLAAARLTPCRCSAATFLRAQVHIEQSLQPRFPDVHVADLQDAWRDILKRAKAGAAPHHHAAKSCRCAST
jgi:segregation and condensation protein A